MEKKYMKYFESKDEYYKVIEAAFNSSLAGICIYDNNGRFVCHNKMHEDISEYTAEMLQSFTAHNLANMEREGVSSTVLVLKNKKDVIFEQNMIPTNKQFITKGIPWFDENGTLRYVISNIIDLEKLIQLRDFIRKDPPIIQENLQTALKDTFEDNTEKFVYHSNAMKQIVDKVLQIKDSDATVLLLGESGTGKEIIAKLIHEQSKRKQSSLIKINCSAIPEALMESELFGYEAGSFTGGNAKGKIGLLEYAKQGTVLLDEIGDMPLNLQTKMLRVLQEQEIQKIGRNEPIKINVRFIASTNLDLEKLVDEGKFRRDLYYRLNVVPITVPPLRERREDIPILANYFIEKYNKKYCVNKTISNKVIAELLHMEFPGNIREMENLMERLVLFARDTEISLQDLELMGIQQTERCGADLSQLGQKGLKGIMEDYERDLLRRCMKKYGSARKMAVALKVDHSTISKKIRKYNL